MFVIIGAAPHTVWLADVVERDPKIDVWLHDISPETQSGDRVSHRYERSCSTQTFLPDAGFSIRTGKRSVGGARSEPVGRCRVPF